MTNIRVVRLSVKSNTVIEITFTATPDSGIGIDNFVLEVLSGSAPTPEIVSVVVSTKKITLTTRPLVFRAYYKITLQSTNSQPFIGSRGESFIEDGATNQIYFVGPQDIENGIRDLILGDLPDIYNTEPGTLVYDTIDAGAKQILQTYSKSNEVGSANYISVQVENEEKTRGASPYDRLTKEGAYQVIRVARTQNGVTDNETFVYDEFPIDQVSLQQILVSDESVLFNTTGESGFYKLIITLGNFPVIIVTSIVLVRDSEIYTYDIERYKYGLLDSKYDSENAYSAYDIESSQVKLNNAAIGPNFPVPSAGDTIIVSYYYKKLGRIVNGDSLEVYETLSVTRESAPPLITTFFLKRAPVVDENGVVPVLNGVTWLDPAQNYDITKKHPAFITEIQYNAINLPQRVGEFSVNYETGQVFVFGANGSGTDGTTAVPPVANYLAKVSYVEGLDYIFDSEANEIASIPERELRGNPAVVYFEYEDTFADGTDFAFKSHIEATSERVQNRLIDTVGIRTLNGPVTEVFRIYNETTGEIYTSTRIKDNEVYFTSVNPPKTVNVTRETVEFEQVLQSEIVVIDTITDYSFDIFKAQLEDTDIASAIGWFFGSSFNTSLMFSESSIFINEMYYDPTATEATNLSRLLSIGDYMVNYEFGIVYVGVGVGASTDLGYASYCKNQIKTRNAHIVSVSDIYRSKSVNFDNTETIDVNEVYDETIDISLEQNGETEVDGVEITVDSGTVIVSYDVYKLYKIYQVTDLKTTIDPIDFSLGATISTSTPTEITLDASGVEISDTGVVQLAGSRQYVEASRISALVTGGLAELVSARAVVNSNGTNYWDQGTDGYVDSVTNRIYLPSAASALGVSVETKYNVALRSGAAVLVSYITGNMYVDYTYVYDEILIDYEYGDNTLDWSVSSSLSENETYYVTYKYGALRNSIRDNFGIFTNIEELSVIPENLDRETYRHAVQGALQTFPKGPTIEAIKGLVSALTRIDPNITESVFLEWVLGRDYLNLLPISLSANSTEELPTYEVGKFGNGLLLSESGQVATMPAISNLRFAEGTWESFIIPNWDGIDNDASLTFDLKINGSYYTSKIFIGSDNINPETIPFTLDKENTEVYGRPSDLHVELGYFIWYDTTAKKWRLRIRSPILESRRFVGTILTSGEFGDVSLATTADGYNGYDGYYINETNDYIRTTNKKVWFSFIVDGNDYLNMNYDAYDSYYGDFAGFDGIDFTSDNIHYIFDTGETERKNRMSLYKDGKGFLRYRVYDNNEQVRMLSANISNWERFETHHVATSWKIGTIEQRDSLHLFVDGAEVPNTYRYKSYLLVPDGEHKKFMDEATEILISNVTSPTLKAGDLETTVGSNSVRSASSTFLTDGVQVGDAFIIVDNTLDGTRTRSYPYVYVKNIISEKIIELQDGLGADFNLLATLDNVKFSLNTLYLQTVSDTSIEKLKVFSADSYGEETELYSPNTVYPDYEFYKDGYRDFVEVYGGVSVGGSVLLRSYGITIARCKQNVYLWPDNVTNLLSTITPPPTSISKIDITKILIKSVSIENSSGSFGFIATLVGGHIVMILTSNLTFCQVSNSVTGKRLETRLFGNTNIDFTGINKIIFTGSTSDGAGYEEVDFTEPGTQTTSKFFTELTDVIATFTPIDIALPAGIIEVREAAPINWQENSGSYAEVRLSVQEQNGIDGYAQSGTSHVYDSYAIFTSSDIGKIFVITSPAAIAGNYTISDVQYDDTGLIKDSSTAILDCSPWNDSYSSIVWKVINTSYGDSGFANGLITLEIYGSGGLPFLLGSCWYEVDFPTYLSIPWGQLPENFYIGSDMSTKYQANAIIDEMRILDEVSSDTGRGETTPSSGRSITTDYLAVRAYSATTQTLGLFHFDDNVENSANFYTNFSGSFRQSENSVNSYFEQSAIFNLKKAYEIDNRSIFKNKEGTIEFWVSPILDTYNDPTRRYYIDLSPEQSVDVTADSPMSVTLPVRVRSISNVSIIGTNDETNYFTGGSLQEDGKTITLGQPLPVNKRNVSVTYVPINNSGDRFSIYKSETGELVLLVTASGVDFQISSPVYWKKDTWHRVFVGWNLNNSDNQDRLVLMVDGTEGGIIRYGTGLRYGAGYLYGQPTVWGSATAGTEASRNILADINLTDIFNTVYVGADFTSQYPAMARMDNIRFSSILRPMTYIGELNGEMIGTGPGRLIGKDLVYTSNLNSAQPVIEDAYTNLLLDFNTSQEEVRYLAVVHNAATGIFDFYVEVIDTFELIDTDLAHSLVESLISRLKPAHTRAFVSFTK